MSFARQFFTACLFGAFFSGSAGAAMQAGVATLDITPKEPVWLAGFAARTKPSQGVRQKIWAKALALRDEKGVTAVLITTDLLGFTGDLAASVAKQVESRYQVPRKLLMLNASHTHSAPVIGSALAPAYPLTDADRAVIARYTVWLDAQLVDLVGRSLAGLQPAQLTFGQGLAGLAVNRRRIGNPEYPNVTDPDLPVLIVRGANGALWALVFGYACHNTTLDDLLVSGDWAGYAQSSLEAKYAGAVAMFVQDCGADANPLPRHTETLAKWHGEVIAAAVSEVVDGKPRKLEGALRAAFREVDLPLEPAAGRDEWMRRSGTGSGMDRRYARMMLTQLDRDGKLPSSHVWQAQAWKIGDLTLLALGGEVVADYALRFKRQYGFRNLWVAGYSNEVFAYIPSKRVWQEGGYEGGGSMVPYGLPARFDSSVEDRVAAVVEDLMQDVSEQKRLIVMDPGHFHATLLQKEMYPQLDRRVNVYAPLGPELLDYLNRISLFNTRAANPTKWDLDVHATDRPMEEMLQAKAAGSVVVFSGRNRGKVDRMLACLNAGLHVLADKPWIITSNEMPKLEQALDLAARKGLAAYDIMTERYEVAAQVQRALVGMPEVFGTPVRVDARSVHHIMKNVAGVPLRRPVWFFDVDDYGEGLADVGTHPVDLIQWTLFPDQLLDYRKDVRMVSGRHDAVPISKAQFEKVTGAPEFPAAVASRVTNGVLDYFCNNYIEYSLRGVPVKLDVLWKWEATPGTGDIWEAAFVGTRARVELRGGDIYVVGADPAALAGAAATLQARWPGISLMREGLATHLLIPDKFKVGHEEHFAQVARHFFDYVKDPKSTPAWERAYMLAKYYVTTMGVEMARK